MFRRFWLKKWLSGSRQLTDENRFLYLGTVPYLLNHGLISWLGAWAARTRAVTWSSRRRLTGGSWLETPASSAQAPQQGRLLPSGGGGGGGEAFISILPLAGLEEKNLGEISLHIHSSIKSSVVDLHWFHSGSGSALVLFRIRIQLFTSILIRIQIAKLKRICILVRLKKRGTNSWIFTWKMVL